MRILLLLAGLALAACAVRGPTPTLAAKQAHACANDYLTAEKIEGTVREIKPAPEPFPTADIALTGPAPCTRMWMQVLKNDAARCQVGDAIEATGVVTEDVEDGAWQINPVLNPYMTFAEDFRCHS